MKKNKIISLGILIVFFFTLISPKTVYSYESNSTIYFKEKFNIPITKVWTINFNSNFAKDSENLSKINIYDENNNPINTIKNASTDNKVVVQAV